MLLNKFFVILVVSFSVAQAHANFPSSCRNLLLIAERFDSLKTSIERLNGSGFIGNDIYVSDSVMTMAIRRSRMEDAVTELEAQRQGQASLAFYDEISLAIAMRENQIARLLLQSSPFDFRQTPFGHDLMITAAYFGNVDALHFLERYGISLTRAETATAIRYALMTRTYDVLPFLMRDFLDTL